MQLGSLHDVFALQIQDLYSAENQLVDALPKMAKATDSTELRSAIDEHLDKTREHVRRLEQIAKNLEIDIKGVLGGAVMKCKAMEGLIKEGEEVIKNGDASILKDLALIAAAQRVEHYEISAYGTSRTLAAALDYDDAVDLLEQTLDEEKEADEVLTDRAEDEMEEYDASQSEEL